MSILAGLILTLASIFVVRYQDYGVVVSLPMSGGTGAGYPLRFVQTSDDYPEQGLFSVREFGGMLFAADIVLWSLAFLTIFVACNFGVVRLVAVEGAVMWIVAAILLSPLLLTIFGVSVTSSLATSLLGYAHPLQSFQYAEYFVRIAYVVAVMFVSAIVFLPVARRSIRDIAHVTAAATAVTAVALVAPLMRSGPTAASVASYPFRVLKVTVRKEASHRYVDYKLHFVRLPAEDVDYFLSTGVSSGLSYDSSNAVGVGEFGSDLRQKNGVITQLQEWSYTEKARAVEPGADVTGTIALKGNKDARYLWVLLHEQSHTSESTSFTGYPVPIGSSP